MYRLLVPFVFFMSGAAGLIYEIVWARMLSSVLGSDVIAVSIVTSVFMAGLAIGSWLFGKKADQVEKPFFMYSILEIAVGLSALSVTAAFPLLNELYPLLLRNLEEPQAWTVKILLAVAMLIVPTVFMGGTLPTMSRFMTSKLHRIGRTVAGLYGINTLGSVLGCFIGGFFMIENLGLKGSSEIAVYINLSIGFLSFPLSRKDLKTAFRTPHRKEGILKTWDPPRIKPILALYALAGFTSLAYEVIWTRILSNLFLTTSYAFSTMLSVYLLSLAIGSFLMKKTADRMTCPLFPFSLIELAIGGWALISIPLFTKMPGLVGSLNSAGQISWLHHTVIMFCLSSVVIAPPSLLMGMAFPLVNKACAANEREIGFSVGKVYFFNTVGCIAGSLATGFLLLPFLGLQSTVTCMAVLNILIGASSLLISEKTTFSCLPVAVTVVAISVLVGFIPKDMISRSISSRLRSPWKLTYYHEGADNSTMIFKNTLSGVTRMMTNFHQYIGDNSKTMTRIQKWQAHLPLLLAENPQRTLIVGGGTGITTGAASLYDANITCCEMSEGVLEASKYFKDENRDYLRKDSVQLIREDGRNYLLRSSGGFDVIIGDLYNAAMSGMVNLYTKEYYSLCRDHLKTGGIMCQWISMKDFPEDAFKSVMATFCSVFPHFSLWFASPDIIAMIGGKAPLHLNLKGIDERMKSPKLTTELREIGLDDPFHLMGHLLMGQADGESFVSGFPVVTDDFPFIEYSIPRSMHYLRYKKDMAFFLRELNSHRSRIANKKQNSFEKGLDRCYRAKTHVFEAYALFLEGHIARAEREIQIALNLYPMDMDAKILRWNMDMDQRKL
ncbi:MAG: fused MFS/spermidine synthase [Synergistota bacterium]|nr:fused MFS/spermidine synthase [Synergistota bacterium]